MIAIAVSLLSGIAGLVTSYYWVRRRGHDRAFSVACYVLAAFFGRGLPKLLNIIR